MHTRKYDTLPLPYWVKRKNLKGKVLKEEQVHKRLSKAIILLSRKLKIPLESLNIRPSPKGLITGPVHLYVHQQILADCNYGGMSVNLILSELDLVTRIQPKRLVRYVLLIEKETIFHHLVSKLFHEKQECILVTGKGEPDVATRILLRKLKDTFRTIPFLWDIWLQPIRGSYIVNLLFWLQWESPW